MIRLLFIFAFIPAFIYMGFILNIEGARNVFLAYIWLTSLIGVACISDAVIDAIAKNPPTPAIQLRFEYIVCAIIMGFLVWHGYFFTVLVYGAGLFCAYIGRSVANSRRAQIARAKDRLTTGRVALY